MGVKISFCCEAKENQQFITFNQEFSIFLRMEETDVCKHWRKIHMYLSSNGLQNVQKMTSSLRITYATGLRTERKHLPSFVSSLVKHMHGRGIASSRRAIVLNLHFLRWSAMLAMLANFHSFTVPKAVLNRHT